tara:strand:- start:256 stop:402 length:147 start_codon:yes stop_codon:yes gene_type:complete
MKKLSYLVTTISIVAYFLACTWFGWKMGLILFLSFWANNIENSIKYKK